MTKLKICEIDLSTGKEIVREMNEAELLVMAADQALKAQELQEAETKSLAKSELLAKMGITEAEAKLLLS
jgi:hypothetical protein